MRDYFNSSRKSIITLFIVIVLLFSGVVNTAGSSQLDELRQEHKNLNSKILEQQKKVNEAKKREKTATNELQLIERELELTELELEQVTQKLLAAETQVRKIRAELEEAEEEVEEQEETLKVRVVGMYKNGPVDYLEVILDSQSFSEFITRMDIIGKIIAYDSSLLNSLMEHKQFIADKKVELELQRDEILAARSEINVKKRQMEAKVASRGQVLRQIQNDKKSYEAALKEMEASQNRLNRMIAELQGKENKDYMGTATFTWPVPISRKITSEYGWRVHPIHKTRKFHTGLDIGGAPAGSNIVAATHGKVIHAGSLGGYGLTVVLDHGGGISTMYAHCSRILVKVGQYVNGGDIIAKVGSTGISTGPHLHFEVKINGNHTDPWKYL
ncbi:MAG TPA: peptidoglycan DD-metalloendopeptidase family protein [Thermoanaerobacterales bacterium]|nr:peptidoglycan DD-metalloendopeptidase family protein [Thermoanaerobacterales bacterium]